MHLMIAGRLLCRCSRRMLKSPLDTGYYHPPGVRVERCPLLTNERAGVYLKYALFCRETVEGNGDELSCSEIIDLVDIEMPDRTAHRRRASCVGGSGRAPRFLHRRR